ncbi:phage tail tape measure protein [Bacillus capparidis]|uniref:TP901 family phage tail tape measure protein n=1 Tax=Bacillus capparidis TaxID=1840411 RepID=A0ABS4D1L0_9BACI|nr:phage tail tape measure protein [Bacillus capparidis]MBP1083507.1 TP901 family phage tail tape measure protein [Bacillus capparidis]MED1094706.1 phage tail tape measure protein [Bacillus capparidis]
MAEVGVLRISLGLEDIDFTRGMKNANARLRALDNEFRAITAGSARFDNSLEALGRQSGVLTRSLGVHQQKVEELRRRYDESKRTKGEDATETIRAASAYNRALTSMRRMEQRLEAVNRQINEQSNSFRRLRTSLNDTGENMQRVGGRMQSTGADISQSFGIATAAIGGGLAIAAKSAMDFESQMSSVKSVMAPDEAKEFGGELEKLAVTMGAKTKYSATEAAQGIEELIKAGVQTTDIINGGLDGALSLATAGELELADAAEIASTALNAFKDDNLSVMQAADLLAGAANASATSVSEMKFGLSAVSAVASGIGLTFEDTTAALAAFSQNGLKGSDAGTSLKTMLLNLSPSTKEATNQMRDLGLITEKGNSLFYDSEGHVKSLADISQLLKDKLKSLTDEQRQMALKTMFGTDAIRAANILYKEGANGINNMATAMGKVKSADVAAEKLNNVKGRLEQLKGSVETAAISLGNALLPTLDKVVAGVQDATDWFNSLDKETQNTIATTALVATGIAGVTAALGVGLTVVGGAISGFGALTVALGAMTGPMGLVVTGLGLATAAGFAIADSMNKSKEVNLEHAESMIKQQHELEGLTGKYDVLREKNQLSNDELLRFKDIQSELKFAKSAEEIKSLTDEADRLREKSGLSNEEMSEMLSLNDQLIDKVPDAATVLSDHGNSIIGNRDALGEANEKLRENIALELENQRIKAEANLTENIRNYINALDELREKEAERDEVRQARDETEKRLADLKIQAQNELNAGKDLEAEKTIDEIANAELLLNQQNNKISLLADEVAEKQNSVTKSEEEIGKTQELYDKMINLHLEQVGINASGAEGIAQLDQAIEKTQNRINELNNAKREQSGLNKAQQTELNNLSSALGLYQSAKGEIRNIQGEQQSVNRKIDEGTGKASSLTGELGKDVNKNVDVDDNGKADDLNEKVRKSVKKKVTLAAIWEGVTAGMRAALPFFAKGTRNAPGGLSVVGEEGPELVHLPQGAKVIPNPETEAILRNWNIPMLASGGVTLSPGMAMVGEEGPEMLDLRGAATSPLPSSQPSESDVKQPVVIQVVTPEKRELARWLLDDITKMQDFKEMRLKTF